MKLHKNTLILIMLLAFLSPVASAQDVTTQGTEFWLSFISNGYKYHPDAPQEGWLRVQLLVSAKRDCEGTITNPNTGWSRSFTVEADTIFSIDLDETQVYVEADEYERVVNKGLLITTTDTVSVYCANIAIYSFDASFVLPIQGLADDYIIQTYNQSTSSFEPTSAFVIVATEDNTTIDITPSIRTLGGRPANEEFNITLNKGEAYQVRSKRSNYLFDNSDISGTRVTARDCKKIAIFNGNNLTLIPITASSDADCIFEQAMPLRSWGRKFIITSSLSRYLDYYRITSSADDNIIYKNGEILDTLNANETLEYQITSSEKSCYIETTHSCAVYLYNNSSNDSGNGAPSMVWIAPIEQRIDEITFSTFNYDHENVNISNHYVNIIVETQDVERVYFDNQLLPSSQFQTVTGNGNYSFCQMQISHGVHQLSCPNGLNAHVYGFGRARGYAYMVGSKATDLSTTILINDEVVMPNDTVSNCLLDPITFKADINLNNYTLVWDFGDGTTSTENPVVHTYPANELYQAKLTVTAEATPCGGSSSSHSASVLIDARTEPDTNVSDEICAGDLYSGYGFDNILIRHDTILTREQPGSLNPNCISHINVSITCYPTEPLTLTDQVCFNGPGTYTENGFNIHYDRPDTTYTVTQMMPNEFGCYRSVTMVLHISHLTDNEPDIITDCNYYTWPWNGETYYENVSIDDTIADPETGCYEIGHLRLNLNYTPTPRLTYADDDFYHNGDTIAVITNTEFFSFNYDFFVEDSLGHFSDWDLCSWHISKESWIIEPFIKDEEPDRRYCKVYVAEYDDDPVELSCTVYNSHCEPDSITRRFYLKSSFFGVDDDESHPDISIVPNPSNGSMALVFGNIQGPVATRVYDMTGKLIDAFELNVANDNRFAYHLDACQNGIYLFVFNYKGISVTQKVILTK